jgi:hypothetical protein
VAKLSARTSSSASRLPELSVQRTLARSNLARAFGWPGGLDGSRVLPGSGGAIPRPKMTARDGGSRTVDAAHLAGGAPGVDAVKADRLGRSVGPSVGDLVERILIMRPHPEDEGCL